jgi:hypothetical protein
MATNPARNPRAEAQDMLPDGHEARVLEPSPPAVTDSAWYADDPTDPESATGVVVSPVPGAGITWDEMAAHDARLAAFAADRWLGSYRRLAPLPTGYVETRGALHQVAFFVLAPARFRATGKLGLRYTHGGFGTPFFGGDEQVRVDGISLVRQQGDRSSVEDLTTIEAAAAFLDLPYEEVWFEDFRDPLAPSDPSRPLEVERASTAALADWFGFATSVLEEFRRHGNDGDDVSRVQLWPEHFDVALEMGSQDAGVRASYGASPGDAAHPEPYLYVAAWSEVDRSDPYWNDESFNGASLGYRALLEADDQRATALEFFDAGYAALHR